MRNMNPVTPLVGWICISLSMRGDTRQRWPMNTFWSVWAGVGGVERVRRTQRDLPPPGRESGSPVTAAGACPVFCADGEGAIS